MDISGAVYDAESMKQPQDDCDHNDEVKDGLDCPLHGDEGVDQPKENADDDQGEHYGEERHDRG
jgi:hypothetical protein